MANDRLIFAIARLERAAMRVERHINEMPSTPLQKDTVDHSLLERHARLRDHMQAAITRIDTLIKVAEG